VPTMPFLQHSITNLGPEIKNIGAAITGSESDSKNLGFDILYKVFKIDLNIIIFIYH
jgi:hypothetical protein